MRFRTKLFRWFDRATHLVPLCVGVAFAIHGGGKQRGIPGGPAVPVLENPPAAFAVTNSAIANWNRRGAWDDSFRLDFEGDWVFPWGSNHLTGVEVLSRGEVWPRWDDTNAIAVIDVPLAIVPGLTRFSCERTDDDSYVLSWTNAAPNRATNFLSSAAIELKRCGDRVVTLDGVISAEARELPFAHYGWGQDDEWVGHYFSNEVAEISSAGGYTNWVDSIALTPGNGFYKLTVTISNAPPETVNLAVGEYSVAVTNAGEYVFLLEKAVLYPIGFSFLPDGVAYSFDDGGPSDPPEPDWPDPPGQSRSVSQDVYYYTYSATGDPGHGQELVVPNRGGNGYTRWWPSLTIYPYPDLLGVGEFAPDTMFAAVVYDIPLGETPTVTWESGGSVIERGEYLTIANAQFFLGEIDVTAVYRGVELHGKIVVERHVRQTGISLSGGGVIFMEGEHLGFNGEPVQAASQAEASIGLWWALTAPGTLRLESSCGGSAAVRVGGSDEPVSLPLEWHADADEAGFSNLVVEVSGAMTNGQFTFSLEFDDDWIDSIAETASIAVVELEVEAVATWPTNRNRHVFGPKEQFTITTNPSVELSCYPMDGIEINGNTVTAPDRPGAFSVWLTVNGIVCDRIFNCIEPASIHGKNPRLFSPGDWEHLGVSQLMIGEAGADMRIDTWLEPTYVSFKHLRVYEGYAPVINRTGWYADVNAFPDDKIEHGANAGASNGGQTTSVLATNNETGNGDCVAAYIGARPAYTNGSYQLSIPVYWFAEGGGYTNSLPNNSLQTAWVYSDGTMKVEKSGCTLERMTNGVFRTTGIQE